MNALERECDVFCRYLGGQKAPEKLFAKYREAHEAGVVAIEGASTRFDRALVGCARFGTFPTRLADAHARLFRNGGLLRRKLVLVLALLETHADTVARVDAPTVAGPVAFVVETTLRLAVFAALAALGLVVFVPLRIACSLGGDE
jgi:hypothetical protein